MGRTADQPTVEGTRARGRLAQWRGRGALALALIGFAVLLALVALGDTAALDLRITVG